MLDKPNFSPRKECVVLWKRTRKDYILTSIKMLESITNLTAEELIAAGTVAVNKPKGVSSHRVINELRKYTGLKRIGHAGTLDPLASGVLVVAIGRENTKKISEIVKDEKEYVADIRLDGLSATQDMEGPITAITLPEKLPSLNEMAEAVKKFIGKIKQTPSIYSAIKIDGKPAYKYAREGKDIEMRVREVEIKSIEILEYNFPMLKLKVQTGPGTYIRTLAEDLGRTRVGGFEL